MSRIMNLFLMFLPSFLQVPIRRMMGQKIGKGSKVRFGTLLISSSVNIGEHATIGPFCLVRAETLEVGDYSSIKALSIVSTRVVKFGKYVHIAPLSIIMSEFTINSSMEIGDHSRIFPFSWMDTGEGIKIGKQSAVGTHSLIYTHGTWSDYLQGAPIAYGPVIIHDHVWIPTRVTILPNVELKDNTIVGANSLINKSFPANVMIGGSPAKLIKENVIGEITTEQKRNRGIDILTSFSKYVEFKHNKKSSLEGGVLKFEGFKIVMDDIKNVSKGDLLMMVNNSITNEEEEQLIKTGISIFNHQEKTIKISGTNIVYKDFISYLRRYGIRLYIYQIK